MLVTQLDPAPSERVYKLWIVRSATPRPDGTFAGERAADVVRLQGRVRPGDVVAVTVERNPDVPAPTTDPLLTAQA